MTAPRDAAAGRVFPPGVPLLALLLALGLDRLWPLAPGVELPVPARLAAHPRCAPRVMSAIGMPIRRTWTATLSAIHSGSFEPGPAAERGTTR